MNTIEKVWNELKNMVEEESQTIQEELKNSIKKNWKKNSLKKILAQILHLTKIIPKSSKMEENSTFEILFIFVETF